MSLSNLAFELIHSIENRLDYDDARTMAAVNRRLQKILRRPHKSYPILKYEGFCVNSYDKFSWMFDVSFPVVMMHNFNPQFLHVYIYDFISCDHSNLPF